MPKTVEDILRESGLTDEQIKAIDEKVKTGLTQVVSTAAQTLEQAENVKRLQAQQYEQEIAPALDKWANEKAAADTKLAAYEAALKAAKEGGFQIPEILNTAPAAQRDQTGRFVTGANQVPGSPAFVDIEKKLRDDLGGAFSFAADTQWKYRSLFGTEMPDAPTAIIREAAAQRMSPADYAAKKYGFAEKEAARKAEEKKKEIDAAVTAAVSAKEKEWAERGGNNPNLRQAITSQFSTIDKAVKEGTRPDPLKMTREQRHAATRQVITRELAENAAQA
jgi:hypothetical protein